MVPMLLLVWYLTRGCVETANVGNGRAYCGAGDERKEDCDELKEAACAGLLNRGVYIGEESIKNTSEHRSTQCL